ncbi:MAG: hypothetical protein JNL42_13020 [Anaerolineae bacterium]|nr:hypothetical protein [Anaerolineae bacterium]
MTVAEILHQAKALSVEERKELAKLLIDTLDSDVENRQSGTGADIVAMLRAIDPIEFVDPHLDDPVEWVKAQRRKRADRLRLGLDEAE